ncbi:hypothetical protein HNQ50_000184 [Silvimonas terrae]|uniref:Uncharacterized protein n=1 Tax=Silvimonas terrae TaxID=300266 RepID=A0A840RA46_9NEIS|nr:hypothetical protein [Silvimonas terrae]MBB5189474.1 hypothetical protein [Silvimonas terrae]
MQSLNEFEVQLVSGGDGYGTDGGYGYGGVGTTGGFGGGGMYGNGQGTQAVGGSGGGTGATPGYQQSSLQTGYGYPASGINLNGKATPSELAGIVGLVISAGGFALTGGASTVANALSIGVGLTGAALVKSK